jgi:hypothetical protein
MFRVTPALIKKRLRQSIAQSLFIWLPDGIRYAFILFPGASFSFDTSFFHIFNPDYPVNHRLSDLHQGDRQKYIIRLI